MAEKKPIVIGENGNLEQLQDGDTIAGAEVGDIATLDGGSASSVSTPSEIFDGGNA